MLLEIDIVKPDVGLVDVELLNIVCRPCGVAFEIDFKFTRHVKVQLFGTSTTFKLELDVSSTY